MLFYSFPGCVIKVASFKTEIRHGLVDLWSLNGAYFRVVAAPLVISIRVSKFGERLHGSYFTTSNPVTPRVAFI